MLYFYITIQYPSWTLLYLNWRINRQTHMALVILVVCTQQVPNPEGWVCTCITGDSSYGYNVLFPFLPRKYMCLKYSNILLIPECSLLFSETVLIHIHKLNLTYL
jgi:hypothetical protein